MQRRYAERALISLRLREQETMRPTGLKASTPLHPMALLGLLNTLIGCLSREQPLLGPVKAL